MREEQSEDKMNRIDKYKYHVVKFLDNHLKDTERASLEHACVPRSWLTWRSPESNVVRVWYPPQNTCNTEEKVRKREKKSNQWESFLAILMYSTDMYEEAKMHIRKEIYSENNNKEDHTPSHMVEKKSCKTSSSVIENEATVVNRLDAISQSISSQSANSIQTLKRKAPAEADKTAHRKLSRVNEPSESVDEVAGPSSQTFINQKLTQQGSNKDPSIQETRVVKSNDGSSTEKIQINNQDDSRAIHSLDPKLVIQLLTSPTVAKCSQLILELRECLGNSLPKEIMTILINTYNSVPTNDNTASASRDTPVQAPKLNGEKKNKEQMEENDSDVEDFDVVDSDVDDSDVDDCDDVNKFDDDEPKTKQKCSRQLKPFVLPLKYEANDSRWTLKYRGPGPGLVELMKHSGVYVRATSLENCDMSPGNSYDFARRLLSVVFTASALRTCSWTGKRPPGYSQGTNYVRPGLDAHAREVLLNFVIAKTKKGSYGNVNSYRKSLITRMATYLLSIRRKTSK